MKLIIGLGNPGKKYIHTRHNVGFQLLDYYALKNKLEFKLSSRFNADILLTNINNEQVIFLKPNTFMNLSGDSVIKVMNYYKISTENILVFVDDINIAFSTIRIRTKGSSGGHNGLKDITLKLSTQDYKRVRIGVGSNNTKNLSDYVLSNFSVVEQEVLSNNVFETCYKIINDFIYSIAFTDIMSKYNS